MHGPVVVKTFEETDAWQAARALAHAVYELCRREPLARDFGLCDQLRRASVSAMNNIAEGWESIHLAEKRQAYNYARRSCGEVRSMTYLLSDSQLAAPADIVALRDVSIRTGQLISGLIRSLDRH